MIPIRDTISSKNYPIVNSALISINVLFYLIEVTQGVEIDRFIYIYGLVPARYSIQHISSYFTTGQQFLSFFSFMFLHGGFWHLFANMWSLYIFGDNVEDSLGSLRYLIFYLLCGITSGLFHLFLNLHSNIPTIGASGAIAGVMGAYFILYPNSKILTLIPIFFIPYFIEIPAFFFLGFWFFLQFLNAMVSPSDVSSGIAWWAHIGGFIFGIIFLKIFLKFPTAGAIDKLRRLTKKKKTHRLQVIRLKEFADSPHLYGTITITPYETLMGAQKLISIPLGFHKKLIRVMVPPGIKEGNVLRLKEFGKQMKDGRKGDFFLKILIE